MDPVDELALVLQNENSIQSCPILYSSRWCVCVRAPRFHMFNPNDPQELKRCYLLRELPWATAGAVSALAGARPEL